jgi:vancomycin resistance protein VanJ
MIDGAMFGRLQRFFSGVLVATAVIYPIALALAWLLLYFVGERWWITSLALYLPPVGFASPLVLLVPALVLSKRRRLLALQLLSLLLVLFPLMGLNLSWQRAPAADARALRLVSYNVNSAYGGFREIAKEVLANEPDLVFLQELGDFRAAEMSAALGPDYPHSRATHDLYVASRFPILAEDEPPRLPFFNEMRSPRFTKLVIETPLGIVTFFNVHAVSPRGALHELRGDGLRKELASGRLLRGERAESLQVHAALRRLQVKTMSELAAREAGPVVIVGDTNLPVLSPVRREYLGGFRDGFSEAGSGFGYTFPARWPWMRIDVVLASSQLRFTKFDVGSGEMSDHRAVYAELIGERSTVQAANRPAMK